jgi:hypothetical protein
MSDQIIVTPVVNELIVSPVVQDVTVASPGPQGAKGDKGDTGNAATITVGSTTTGAAGTSATVTNTGTSSAAVLAFTIPQGATGATGSTGATGTAATVTVGSTTTGGAGTSATVTNSGTTSAAVLDFTVPQGIQGPSGVIGVTAPITNSGTSTSATLGIQDASTSQKGAVQLTDSVASTSTTTAATPNSVKTTYDAVIKTVPQFPYVTGRFYRSQYPSALTSATTSLPINTTYYTPVYISATNTFNQIAIIAGASFVGSATVRIGIYNNNDGSPSTVLLDAGTVNPTTASTTYAITISQTLNSGWYWFAFNCQAVGTTNTYYGNNTSAWLPWNLGLVGVGSNAISGYSQAATVTSGFATASTLTVFSASLPTVALRSA